MKTPIFICGPCVIEEQWVMETVANVLANIRDKYDIEIYFKASFDKANRTSYDSYRGPGIDEGLRILQAIKEKYKLPILTDVHEQWQVSKVSPVADIIQIPAFLCRQTDLLLTASKTNKIINLKKGQFQSAKDMVYAVEKVRSTGNEKVIVTERGNMFGYNDLIVDFRNIPKMQSEGMIVIMDCTHSVQIPNQMSGVSGGDRYLVESMALAAKAFRVDGYFIETHPEPNEAKSDAASMLALDRLETLFERILE